MIADLSLLRKYLKNDTAFSCDNNYSFTGSVWLKVSQNIVHAKFVTCLNTF